jgi:DTW domain-containing protein
VENKNQRKRKTKDPCLKCGLHKKLCICQLIVQLNNKTRICLVIHCRELEKTTNTGRLALQCLQNSLIRVRGANKNSALDLSDVLDPAYRTLLFYPSQHAVELNQQYVQQSNLPVQLLVPDGNWRQASKVAARHHELKNIPHVKVPARALAPGEVRKYLRTEHFEEGMSTIEAIAYALGIIEGDHIMQPLLKLYQAKLENTLRGRGVL